MPSEIERLKTLKSALDEMSADLIHIHDQRPHHAVLEKAIMVLQLRAQFDRLADHAAHTLPAPHAEIIGAIYG